MERFLRFTGWIAVVVLQAIAAYRSGIPYATVYVVGCALLVFGMLMHEEYLDRHTETCTETLTLEQWKRCETCAGGYQCGQLIWPCVFDHIEGRCREYPEISLVFATGKAHMPGDRVRAKVQRRWNAVVRIEVLN